MNRRPLIALTLAVLAAMVIQPPVNSAAASQQQSATTAAAAPASSASAVVASAERGDLPGITLAINQLRRSDPNTVTVIFTVTNQNAAPLTFDWTWGELGIIDVGNALAFDMSGVYLVEPQAQKKYLVLRDRDNNCLCSTGVFRSGTSKGLTAGTAATMWAMFPAPTSSVTRVTVVVPHFPAFADLPLAS